MGFRKSFLLGSLVFFFFSTRLFLIEKDIPPMDISGYAQIDESYYALQALDFTQYGKPYFNMPGIKENHTSFFLNSQLSNIITGISLTVFGNNYWGLRMGVFIISGFILLILFSFLKKQELSFQKTKVLPVVAGIKWILLAIIISDFSFLFSNIVVEPTIFRLFVLMLVVILLEKYIAAKKVKNRSFFFIGFISVLSWLTVYFTNAFIPLGICLLIVFYCRFNKIAPSKPILFFFGGVFIGLLLFVAYAVLLHVELFTELKYMYTVFGKRTALEGIQQSDSHLFFRNIGINIFNIFRANFLNYNPVLLFLILVSLPTYIYILITDKRERGINLAFISFIFLCSLFLQSFIVNDFFTRKMIIAFPFYLLVLQYVILYGYANPHILKSNWIKFFVLISLCYCIIDQKTLHWIWACDFSESYKQYIAPSIFGVGIFFLSLLFFLKRGSYKNWVVFLLIASILPNLYYSYYFGFRKSSESFKQAMLEIGASANNKYLTGGWSQGFRLYNNAQSSINPYAYYANANKYEKDIHTMINNSKADFIVTHSSDSLIQKFRLIPVKPLLTDGCTGDIMLYSFPSKNRMIFK